MPIAAVLSCRLGVARRTLQQRLARLGLTIALAGACPAQAAEPAVTAPTDPAKPSPAALTPVYVIVGPQTDPALVEVLEAARANLQLQGVELQLLEPAPGQTAAGRARALVSGGLARGAFWLDERTPGQPGQPGELRVFLLDREGSAYVRRVPTDPASVEASREAVWLIVESGSLALATGETIGMEAAKAEDLEPQPPPRGEPEPPPTPAPARPEPPRPAPRPQPAPPERYQPPFRMSYALSYLGSSLARAVPWSSGAAFDVSVLLRRPVMVALGYGLLLPWRSGEPVVSWRHRVELRTGPRYTVGPRLDLHLLAGAAMEALRWRSTSDAEDRGWRATALATLDGSLAVRLKANLWLTFEPGAEVLLNRFAFVECAAGAPSCEGASRRVVLDPWRVRPRARMGLAVQF